MKSRWLILHYYGDGSDDQPPKNARLIKAMCVEDALAEYQFDDDLVLSEGDVIMVCGTPNPTSDLKKVPCSSIWYKAEVKCTIERVR